MEDFKKGENKKLEGNS